MRRLICIVVLFCFVTPVFASDDLAQRLNAVLQEGPKNNNWQVKAAEVFQWINEGRKDFLIVDVRPNQQEYPGGHIQGAIYIPYNRILEPESLKQLPKDKKIVLVCVTGQTQNLPVVGLRALGYNALTMSFGHASWIKGYFGGKFMTDAVNAANYPVVK